MPKKMTLAMILLMAGASTSVVSSLSAQEGPGASKAAVRVSSAARRVPSYFGQVGLTIEQREKIYEIRAKHQLKIAELKQQLKETSEREMAECEGVLTDAQRSLLQQRRNARKSRSGGTPPAPASESTPSN